MTGTVYYIYIALSAGAIATYLLMPRRRRLATRALASLLAVVALASLCALMVGSFATGARAEMVYFVIFAALAVAGAVRLITHRKPLYSALYFVLVALAVAGMFLLLEAEFVAVALVLVYAGAIVVTYVFVIMLAVQQHLRPDGLLEAADYDRRSREPLLAVFCGLLLLSAVTNVLMRVRLAAPAEAPAGSNVVRLGQYIFSKHATAVELAGVLLVAAMVGAIVFARRLIYTANARKATEP